MRTLTRPASRRVALLALALALTLAACGGDATAPDPDPDPDPDACNGGQDLDECLPSWQAYAPPLESVEPTPAAESSREENAALERIDDTGETVLIGNYTFVCTDRTYNFVDNPERALSFNLDQNIIWPGALIQGRTHRDAASINAVRELTIRERAPLSVTVTFNNADNTRSVTDPDAGSVGSALGSMIANAEADGLATATNIDYLARTYASEKQAALEFGFSGRYLAFEASASGSLSRTTSMNTVAAKFVQQMYVAGVVQPSTPSAFFSSAFTPAKYAQQEAAGAIGPANPPLYVSRIGFGRMMVFAMSAKAEASDIQATLRAAYEGVGASAGASLSARQRSILQQSEIRITQVGGDQTNALNAIRSGKLADYFTDRAPLTSAAPLWFELKTLTGEVAHVSEPGTYTETTCIPRLPGTFTYQPEQVLAVPFIAATQRQVLKADVNGDDRMDLVFNERRSGPSLNRVHVALGQASGGFSLSAPVESPHAPAEGWQNFQMLVADIDGDGRDDLVWNHRGTSNVVYSAMSLGTGAFTWRDRQVHAAGGWAPYTVTTGDLNGDGKTDLLWNNRSSTVMRTYFGLAQADSSFSMIVNFVDRAGNYTGYTPATVAHMNGDGNGDVVLSALGSTYNNTYIGRFTPTSATGGTLSWQLHSRPASGWQNYVFHTGDVDGVNASDLIWVNSTASKAAVHRSRNTGSGFSNLAFQEASIPGRATTHIGDFNNDGRADLLLNLLVDEKNELIVGFGTGNGDFAFPAGTQLHPTVPGVGWQPYDQKFVGDVNGDGKSDIVWTNASSDARIFVALSP